MFYTSLHCVNKTSHTVNHYNPEQGEIERNRDPGDEVDLLCLANDHVLVSSILKPMKTFVDVPDVFNRFSRIGNVFFICSV